MLVRSRGTITDSPEHIPHRCLPSAGATTTTTARTAATALLFFARGRPLRTLGRGRLCFDRELHGVRLHLYVEHSGSFHILIRHRIRMSPPLMCVTDRVRVTQVSRGANERSGRVVALKGEQGCRVLVRSRGTITDSPEHRPHRCLPAAGATTTTTARTAATAVVFDDLAWVDAGCEWG